MKGFWLGLLVAAAVGVVAPAAAQAAYTSPSLYECHSRDPKAADPPPPPKLSPNMRAVLPEAEASDEFETVCPVGEVPEPTRGNTSQKVLPPAGGKSEDAQPIRARVSRLRRGRGHGHGARGAPFSAREHAGGSGYWYSWAMGRQEFSASKGLTGLFTVQTNEQPYIDPAENLAGAHSLGQIWASNESSAGCNSTAETGWTESAGQFGDVNPHLFVFGFDCGASLGYAYVGSGNWVQSSASVYPNITVSHNDVFHIYGTQLWGNNWWFYYDGQWVGYMPQSAWIYHFPWVLKRITAGGEVATPNYSTCTDMGYGGLFGGHPWAAMFKEVWYAYENNAQGQLASLWSYSSDPSYYSTGNWNGGYQFRYGGPGWC